jgi:hypothetical protein
LFAGRKAIGCFSIKKCGSTGGNSVDANANAYRQAKFQRFNIVYLAD